MECHGIGILPDNTEMKERMKVLKNRNRIALGAVVAAAGVVPVIGLGALTAAPAGAATTGITCAKGTGKVDSTTDSAKINLSSCNGNTGGSGKTSGSEGAGSGTINWKNGKSTTITENTSNGSKCTNPATIADEVISGTVSADTTKSTKVGAAVSGEFCVTENATTGKIKLALAPGTKFVIAKK